MAAKVKAHIHLGTATRHNQWVSATKQATKKLDDVRVGFGTSDGRAKARVATDQEALDLALEWVADADARTPQSGSWIRATSDNGMLIYYREW